MHLPERSAPNVLCSPFEVVRRVVGVDLGFEAILEDRT